MIFYVGLGHDLRQPVGSPAAPALHGGRRGRGGGGGGGRGGAMDGLTDPVLHVDATLVEVGVPRESPCTEPSSSEPEEISFI